jgi:DNA-binding MarR family transcriptional regulator/predicted N-acetyltransferase YhbS
MALPAHIASLRRFNRLYTSRIGALDGEHLHTPFSLPQARLLYELAQGKGLSASALAARLALDPGHVSRLWRSLARERLVRHARAATDGRSVMLSLTSAGRAAFRRLDQRASQAVGELLDALPAPAQRELVGAATTLERLLGGRGDASAISLRALNPGDLGWVIERHGALYAAEYGWNAEFEALVAEICAKFVRTLKPTRERAWIADWDGVPVGSVFVVEKSRRVAQLRLLLVEPSARGHGIGARLVNECVRFARRAGYRSMTLWTQSVLTSARRIYEAAGFTLSWEHSHRAFGAALTEQVWDLDLHASSALPEG